MSCKCCSTPTIGVSARRKKHFVLSGFSPEDNVQLEIKTKIKALCGVYLEDKTYPSECTHIICPTFKRTEKVLCGLAQGKWILNTDYIIESHRQKKWLDEVDFEWSEHCQSDVNTVYLQAPILNRKLVQQTGKGRFSNWNCAVIISCKQKESFINRLLTAGEASIIQLSFPLSERDRRISKLTHVFCEKESLRKLKLLKDQLCHSDFIINYLYCRNLVNQDGFHVSKYDPSKNPVFNSWTAKDKYKYVAVKSEVNSSESLKSKMINNRGVKRTKQNKNPSKLFALTEKPKTVRNGPLDKFVIFKKSLAKLPVVKSTSQDNDTEIIEEVKDAVKDVKDLQEYTSAIELIEREILDKEIYVDLLDEIRMRKCIELFDSNLEIADELPTHLTSTLAMACDSHLALDHLMWINSLVTQIRYPSVNILGYILWNIIWEGHREDVVSAACSTVNLVMSFHPPCNLAMQDYYCQLLNTETSNHCVLTTFDGWHRVVEIMGSVNEVGHGTEEDHRSNRVFVLKFIVELFERDLLYVLENRTDLSEVPLILRLIWPNNNPSYVNVAVSGLIDAVINHVDCIMEANKIDVVDYSIRFLNMVATCFQLDSRSESIRFCYKSYLPLRLNDGTSEFIYRLANCIQAAEMDDLQLRRLYSILPTWLTLGLSRAMLGFGNLTDLTLSSVHSKPLSSTPAKLTSPAKSLIETPKTSSSLSASKFSYSRCPTNIHRRNFKGETPLHTACITRNSVRVKTLLDIQGIDVNAIDNAGWTPLHEASNHGAVECVRELLSFKPKKTIKNYFSGSSITNAELNVLAVGQNGFTALHDAAINNHVEVVKLLLQRKGKEQLKMKTCNGLTPMDLARTDAMKNILKMANVKGWISESSSLSDEPSLLKDETTDIEVQSTNYSNQHFVSTYHFITSFCAVNKLFEVRTALEDNCELHSQLSALTTNQLELLWPYHEINHLKSAIEQFKSMKPIEVKEMHIFNTLDNFITCIYSKI